ncbi:MAG: hypothetical protein J6K15_14265 [Lachnospiraceae bacterium]|nr:hypothetical protein [Lachnospiraceae bacterium]
MGDVDVKKLSDIEMYTRIMKKQTEAMHVLRTGTEKEIRHYFRMAKDDKDDTAHPNYWRIKEFARLVSPKYYSNNADITDHIRDKIYREDYKEEKGNAGWWLVKEAIRMKEEEELENFLEYCLKGSAAGDEQLERYFKTVNKVLNYNGEGEQEEYLINFRSLVDELSDARKKCRIVISFDNIAPNSLNKYKEEEEWTYEAKEELALDVLDMISKFEYVGKKKGHKADEINVQEMYDQLFEVGIDLADDITDNILSITGFLERCGIDRKHYQFYIGRQKLVHTPGKKLLVALAVYLMPYARLNSRKNIANELMLYDNVEKFLQQNSVTLGSRFATITSRGTMADSDFCALLEEGATTEIFAHMLKHYAKTQDE